MYSNGYVPPRPPEERKRRSQRSTDTVPPRVSEAASAMNARQSGASSKQQWQQGTPVQQGWQSGTPTAAPRPQQHSAQEHYRQNANWQQGAQSNAQPAYQPYYGQNGYGQQPYGASPQGQQSYDASAYGQPGYGEQVYGPQQYGGYPARPYPTAYHGQGGQAYSDAYPHQPSQPDSGTPYGYDGLPPTGGSGGGNGTGSYGGTGGGKPPKKTGKRIAMVLVCLVLLAGLAVGGTFGLRHYQAQQYVEPYNNVFCQGVYVDGISLGGMTPDEGVAAVTNQAQERNNAWSVRLMYQGQLVTEITAAQLGMTVDVIDVLQLAWEQGHTGDIYTRKQAMETLLTTPFEAYTAKPSGNTSVIDGILQEIKNKVYAAPVDAALVEFNPELTYPFTFTEEANGRMLNTEPLKEQLYQMVSSMESGDVEIVPDIIEPTVTVAQLKEQLTQRASVYTPIDKHSTENRTNNIRRCFQSISGYILEPGSKFSFNSVVGQRTLKNGFYEAAEYAYGDLVTGVGGGACQASTTLYQAAVTAGLEIIDRTPHSDSVSYANYGEDATVYWNGDRKIDLVFRNNTDAPIYMVAAVQSDPSNKSRLIARVTLYGASMGEGVRYELTSQTVEVLTAPEEPEYVKDRKASYVTYTDEEYQQRKAKDGYVVESYRVKYINDQITERVLLFTDTYEAKAERIYVGVTKRDTD